MRRRLEEQRERLIVLWDSATSYVNEFRSVGMEPHAEKEMARRSIGRKIARVGRQLKIDDFDRFDAA